MATKKSVKERIAEFSKAVTEDKKAPAPGETVLMAFRVPKSWPKTLRIWALQHDTTVQALCNEILDREFKRLGIF